MAAAAAEAVSRRLGAAVRDLSGAWYGRHMAAAERAIRTRLPLVDLVLEVRDARVPASSAFEPLRRRRPLEPDSLRVVVLNKADLADPSETEKWVAYVKKQGACPCIPVNSHNRESIKELLSVVQSRIWEIKHGQRDCTGTVLLVGIPNVGKSAIVNAMHQIGRIGAAEKGKLKHAIVSSHPGETRDISGYKVASHPNIYVLDTPGVLSPRFANDDSGPILALTGAIKGSFLEEYDIAHFLLAVVNLTHEYMKWENLNQVGDSSFYSGCHEASALKGLVGEIREAKEELESMQAYLKAAERFKDTDETTGLFVDRIRGFAFEIEDVVDEFTYKLEDKHGGFVSKMKKRIKYASTWRRLAHKLNDIKGRLQGAKQRNQDYTMKQTDRNAGGIAFHANQALNFTRDEDLVGITEHKKQLVQWLAGDLEQRCKIFTVWGMPGVGKTTLVAHVYKTIKMDFHATAWVTVSQSYDVQELLKKIAGEFGITADVANMEMERLAQTIYEYLQGKRYILVLDDVWTADVWSEIRTVFPSNCFGRFVITSRKHEVSLLGTSNSAIHLEPLDEDNSWELFCKSAFWNDGERKCPLHLKVLALKFLEKCEGLPIAIACIGSQLSAKGQTSAEWEKAYDELELQLVKNVMPRVETILNVSLEDLPCDLKNCFLHCALFPEDYPIKRRTVMRHWISSGFIKKKGNQTLEEVAEEYLTELVNRSLLQVVERNHTGRLKCCQMHDVIRLVALKKAEKECFGKVYDGSGEFSGGPTRRISIQSRNLDRISPSNASHIRSLHVFERYINIDLLRPILTSSNLLSTLDLKGACIKMLPTEVFNLFNLRYLGLRYTAIESLPETIGRLQNLEVLDAFNAQLLYLPNNIVKLQKLRYLYAGIICEEIEDYHRGSGVKVPSGIRHLTSLQALQCVEASSEILREVGDLTELRKFSVCNVRSEHSGNLRDAVNKMSHLVHLEITTLGEEEVLHLEGLCLPPTFSRLVLQGQLEKKSIPKVLSSWSRLSSLTRLAMEFCRIDEESFPSLLVLRGLCHLELTKAFDGKKLHFTAGCFPRLQRLLIWHAPQLNQVQIEQGAMSNLAGLIFADCPMLKFLPQGIEHLKNLVELYLYETSEELVERLWRKGGPDECKDDSMDISHIRKVFVLMGTRQWIM